MAAEKIRDIDLGWKKIKKELKLVHNSYTQVGIQADAGTEEGGATIAEVGFYNEFGTSKIPARPFMRTAFDQNVKNLNKIKEKEFSKIVGGKRTVSMSLGLLGEFMEGKIKQKITTLREPSNKASTIARKKSSNPLIDTGRMRQSIRHVEIINNKKTKGVI